MYLRKFKVLQNSRMQDSELSKDYMLGFVTLLDVDMNRSSATLEESLTYGMFSAYKFKSRSKYLLSNSSIQYPSLS
jgi:hypothetical protein